MRLLAFLLFLSAAINATPTTKDNSEKELVVTRNFFLNTTIKYTGQHDIVDIAVPLNKVNDKRNNNSNKEVTIFFVEADVNNKGERDYQGLYILKNGTATKILDNGRDATASNDHSNKVYLGASDGIYVYDDTNGSTNKFGSLTDNIIQIEADNKTGVIYFLTNDHQVLSAAENATKENKVGELKDVKEIVIDFNSNLYYYDDKKDLYVFSQTGVKKMEGIPKKSEIKLIRPVVFQEGVFAVVNNDLLNPNATANKIRIVFEVKPTAYAPEATFIQYYASDKDI